MYTKWTSWKEEGSAVLERDMLIAPRAIVLPDVSLQELRCALRHLHWIGAAEHLGDGAVVFAVPENRAAAFEALPNFVSAKYAVKQPVSRHEIGAVETFRFVAIPGYVDSGEGPVTAFISGQFTRQRADDGYNEFVNMLSVVLCAATGQAHRSVFTPIQP